MEKRLTGGDGGRQNSREFQVRRWTSFVICALCYMLVHFHRYSPSVLADEMSKALGVPISQLGIFSSMYYWSYAVMQPFVGCFADVIEPGYILGVSGLCSALGSLVCPRLPLRPLGILASCLIAATILPMPKPAPAEQQDLDEL